jgi:hypothetical protein
MFILSTLLYIISFLTADHDAKDLSLGTLMTCIKYILSPLLYFICLLTAGLDKEGLALCPSDLHLVRLAGIVPVDTFYQLVIHLGLSDVSWNIILEDYQRYGRKVVNFVALCEWRQQKRKKEKEKKISFKDLSDALTEVDHNKHVLCQVGNN